MASHVAIDIEIGAKEAAVGSFLSHVEIVRASPARTRNLSDPLSIPVPRIPDAPSSIEPDALFAIGDRYYALEADMGTESVEAVIKPKIRAYREVVASRNIDDHFGIDNLTVLFVTVSVKRMHNMMAAVASIAANGRSAMFAFAYRPDLAQFAHAPAPDGEMFRALWQRVGFDDLRFGVIDRVVGEVRAKI